MSSLDKLNVGQLVPDTHLLSGGFSIPPELSISRWILFNTRKNDHVPIIQKIFITVTLKNGQTIKVEKKLRGEKDTQYNWLNDSLPLPEF
jgi:hypothetical protein